MPSNGQVRSPEYKRGDSLAYGQASQANRMAPTLADHIDELNANEPPPEDFSPSGEDNFLFAPTDRPEEPVSAGAPFGAGPDFTKYAYESDEQFLQRSLGTLASQPGAFPEVKQLAAKNAKGL
jgi:hypothetical protein